MRLPRFLRFENYKIKDFKEFLNEGRIDVYLERDVTKKRHCFRCGEEFLGRSHGDHFMKIEEMPIMGLRVFLHFRRYKLSA